MVCEVLVEINNKNIDKTFTYHIPKQLESKVLVGKRVLIPFGKRKLEGFVLKIYEQEATNYLLKDIISIIDEEVILNEELLELGKFISKKTLCNLITAYQAMLPSALKVHYGKEITKKYETYILMNGRYKDIIDSLRSQKQKDIMNLFQNKNIISKKDCVDISVSATKSLIEKGFLKEIKKECYRLQTESCEKDVKKELTSEQQKAVDRISVSLNKFQPFLLYGVTGSGKTEVYMQLIEKVLLDKKEALVLVPEISLTPQFVSNFKKRFGNKIAILHSRLSDGEKYDEWRKIVRKEVSIVIGARSAVFAPLTNLGIIIVDEEHSATYKQENNPRYDALDVCIFRAKRYKIPVIFGSATPSIKSYTRAKEGIYELVELKNRVFTKLPKVQLVDMKDEIRKGNRVLCEELIYKLNSCIEKEKQAIILLNRRGYSTVLSCGNCGYTCKCPHCDIPLTYHKTNNAMRCHYCGYVTSKLEVCPECHSKNLSYLGMGTEKLQQWINDNIVGANTVRMDVDTTTRKGSLEKIIQDFKDKKYNILIGTQMIAKGLDFEDVTLVGVVCGDASLNIPDYRSAERTFSLLNQVAGRAGRGTETGEVIIQGFNMEHYSIVYASDHNYQKFYEEEINIRKKLKYPPYCNICLLKFSGKDYQVLSEEIQKSSDYLRKNLTQVIILGPSNANIPKINNVYYMHIIIKYKKVDDISEKIVFLKNYYREYRKINFDIDFNPNQI